MATGLEDLRVLRVAEEVADGIWRSVIGWDVVARDVVGKQLARAADSIGANIAESYGRFHYGEKLQFLYYARGSLFETKYWLNRARERELLSLDKVSNYAQRLSDLARQLNSLAQSLKRQRRGESAEPSVREESVEYTTQNHLFTDSEIAWLAEHSASQISNLQSLISLESP